MRILIVDDDGLVSGSLRQVLGLLGHEAEVVSQVARAMDAQRAYHAEVILLDWNMPDGGGSRVLSELAQNGAPPAHVIVVTGMLAEGLPPEVAGLPILQKPFRVWTLAEMLKSLTQLAVRPT